MTAEKERKQPQQAYDSLLSRLSANAAQQPQKLAMAFLSNKGEMEHKLTYAQLEQRTNDLASFLLNSTGLKPGERAVLVYPPSLEFIVAFLACLKAGITAVPVFPPNPLRRDSLVMFAGIVQACEATHALTDVSYSHQKKLARIRDAMTKFASARQSRSVWPETLEWIVTNAGDHIPTAASASSNHKANNLAFLQFTSGSTSDPKGVMITHDNLAHNLTLITKELQAGPDTVVVSWLPQYHDMGLIGSYLGCLYCGGTGYYLSPLTFLQRPMLWMECVSRYRATHLQAPNFAFKLTARKFETAANATPTLDLSSVRHVINAAEPVDEESMNQFYQTFGPYGLGKVIYPTYGLAEHTVFVCSGGTQILTILKKELEVDGQVVLANGGDSSSTAASSSGQHPEISKMVGCGYPSRQGVTVVIVNPETMESVPEDRVGEIWIQSPSKAAGYFQKPQETIHDFHAQLKQTNNEGDDSDGFLRTGDLGFLHNDELFICGRLKDLIIVGGRNYYPQDIEATAESCSDLVRPGCSAAFTVDPTHAGGEEVALVMELKQVPASHKEIESLCSPLAKSIRSAINQEHSLGISSIAFLKTRTVPKTSSGKIARAWCRKGYIAKTLQVVYETSFKQTNDPAPLEIETTINGVQHPNGIDAATGTKKDAATIRAMTKEDILESLVTDITRVGSIPKADVDTKVPLVTMLDSLTISQFKGLLENNYHIRISDEYLFRESTTVTKLVEVVKLGHAPDDGDGENAAAMVAGPGNAGGLAGCLGCPPGVVCVIL